MTWQTLKDIQTKKKRLNLRVSVYCWNKLQAEVVKYAEKKGIDPYYAKAKFVEVAILEKCQRLKVKIPPQNDETP